ncbi:MAG: cupin domain-containing protein [Actinobacteria bacterium]|nr:cupin domain-containing protein [Actinomycetota bacterium]
MTTAPDAPAATLIARDLDELAAQNPILPGRVSPHRLHDGDGFRLRHLAFDTGAVLAEHVAPRPILVQVLTGRVRFTVGENVHELVPGSILHVPANVRHEVVASEPSRLLITFLG